MQNESCIFLLKKVEKRTLKVISNLDKTILLKDSYVIVRNYQIYLFVRTTSHKERKNTLRSTILKLNSFFDYLQIIINTD